MQAFDNLECLCVSALSDIDLCHGLCAYVVRDWLCRFLCVVALFFQLRQDDTSVPGYEVVDEVLAFHLWGGAVSEYVVATLLKVCHIINGCIGRCRLASPFPLLVLVVGHGAEEIVYQLCRAVPVVFLAFFSCGGMLLRFPVLLAQPVVGCLNHVEQDSAVGNVYRGAAQFLIEGRVVQEVEVL